MSYTYSFIGFSEPVSSLTHLLAALLFLILSYQLIRQGSGNGWHVFFLCVFVFACVFQFSMSGVYHLLTPGGDGRAVLQRLDHAAIFTLIAASFTTVHGLLFRGILRWGILLLVWSIAITGITLKSIFFNDIPEWLGLVFFLSLGWLGLFTGILLIRRFGFAFCKPLFFSGLAYTVGAIIEFNGKLVLLPGVLGPHELFHLAVIAGVASHWWFTHCFASHPILDKPQESLHNPD